MKTLVIHPHDHSTEFLSTIYEGKDWTIVNYEISVECIEIQYNLKSGRCSINDTDSDGQAAMIGKVFYSLHQLQNLYFALTGEEIINSFKLDENGNLQIAVN